MTDVLGYDVNGEALRAGDRVKPVRDVPLRLSRDWYTLSGEIEQWITGDVLGIVEPDANGDYFYSTPSCLRLINSGRDLFEKAKDRALTQGSPDYIERVSEHDVEAAMPWTDPSVDPASGAG